MRRFAGAVPVLLLCTLLLTATGAGHVAAQEIKLKLERSVYLQTVEEEPFYQKYQDFPNLNRKPLYENRRLERNILRAERDDPPDYVHLNELLTKFVGNFGIQNFHKEHDLEYIWKLGQVREILGDTTGALFYYGLALKNNSRYYNEVKLHYDSLQALKRVEYVDLDYYYRIVSARLKIDTLRPPKSVLLKLGDNVNSEYPDYAPMMHPSNTVLLFTSRRDDIAPITDIDYRQAEDLYYTETDYVYGGWKPAKMFGSEINTPFNEGSACLNNEGTVIFFTRCNSPDSYGSCDLFRAEYVNGEWSNVENLGEDINSPAWDSQPALSPDGKALFFTSNRDGGFGRTDLYVSYRQNDGSFGKALNLGPMINTIEDEITPFFHPIFNTLYFSSSGHIRNYGGFDIFKTRLRGEHWDEPINLGPLVNTPGDESYFSIDGKGEQLYYANANPENPRDLDIYSFPMPMGARPDAVFKLSGYMIDSATGKPLTGIVVAIDLDENVEIEPIYLNQAGYFEFRMINDRNYQLLVIGENAIRMDNPTEMNRDSAFSQFVSGIDQRKPIIMDALEFRANSTELTNFLSPQLDVLIAFLNEHPYARVVVSGHTDSDGPADYNMELSRKRADAIRSYILAQTQMDSTKVIAEGYGESRPIFPNDSPEHKARNRRVEFELIIPPQFRDQYEEKLQRLRFMMRRENPILQANDGLIEFESEEEAWQFNDELMGENAFEEMDEATDDFAFDLDGLEDTPFGGFDDAAEPSLEFLLGEETGEDPLAGGEGDTVITLNFDEGFGGEGGIEDFADGMGLEDDFGSEAPPLELDPIEPAPENTPPPQQGAEDDPMAGRELDEEDIWADADEELSFDFDDEFGELEDFVSWDLEDDFMEDDLLEGEFEDFEDFTGDPLLDLIDP